MSRALLALCVVVLFAPPGCAESRRDSPEATADDDRPDGIAPLPGAEPFADDLRARLGAALSARGPGYVPRTEHLREDGSPRYTNRLILESSPYLLQHAHNPVNWFPWGDEAFETARRLGRPVLLSVGYSTCHWCHVMERESFEDEEVARYLNEHYVAIKVDREERPDVDSIYMSAVQALTGRGGWPMTVWLTPDRRPFYGGTYIPVRDGDRGVRTGFLTLLARLREAYDAQPDRVAESAGKLVDSIRRVLSPVSPETPAPPGAGALDAAAAFYRERFDAVHGGMRGAPKFPSSFPVRFLLREHRRTQDPALLDMAVKTLEGMAAGGIHDHIGGGFHRYAVDERWRVPHFEKMLYDNARLAVTYLEGYQATGRGDFAEVARDILDYVAREMTGPEGAFHSATDADSRTPQGELEEGRFFTWTPAEIEAAVGPEVARVVAARFGVTDAGDLDGRNVLHVAATVEQVARSLDLPPGEAAATLAEARERLYRARLARPAPSKDDKILAAWNGLMISAFAVGGQVLDDPALVQRAERAARFVLTRMLEDGRLRRSYRDGRASHAAYLDDYAFVSEGLLHLFEATSEPSWLRSAVALQGALDRHYRDDAGGGYFMVSDDHEGLLAREKPAYDGAEPSGNSVALANLLRLHELTGDDRYRKTADALLGAFAAALRRSPASLSEMLVVLDFRLDAAKEIFIVTPGGTDAAEPFLAELHGRFVPNRVLVVTSEGEDLETRAELVPLLEGKVAKDGRPTAYVCERRVCKRPTTDPAVFAEQIASRAAVAPES